MRGFLVIPTFPRNSRFAPINVSPGRPCSGRDSRKSAIAFQVPREIEFVYQMAEVFTRKQFSGDICFFHHYDMNVIVSPNLKLFFSK
jgi:hypothetical protein